MEAIGLISPRELNHASIRHHSVLLRVRLSHVGLQMEIVTKSRMLVLHCNQDILAVKL